ncbi:uroporphyrinogen-III synthase [Mesobacterium pallidum]|uniref:uroporphyrinogen-III synthase n=1 Tax=Mesobacterium pallidum TaxID=2872037 RepID=UPI001EE2ECAA|nr:uroporphyrinogen-III synthase [Mesobacterium pallidum]
MIQPLPNVLLTRPEPDSRALATWIGGRARVVISPLMEIAPVGRVPDLGGARGVILTSRHAVPLIGPGRGRQAFVVGERTAQVAREAGWDVARVAPDAETLLAALVAQPPDGPLLHLRGAVVRGDLAARLSAAGIETADRVVYHQHARKLGTEAREMLSGTGRVILPLFSPRSAALLGNEAPFRAFLDVVALSPAVADAAQVVRPDAVTVAERPDLAALKAALSGRLDAVTPP